MRIGLFWNNIGAEEYELALRALEARRGAFESQFEAVLTRHLREDKVPAAFGAVFQLLKEHGLDFGVLSHRPAWILDPTKLRELLESPSLRHAAVSVRAGKIQAKGAVFSPKLPYVDEDFIVVNGKRCQELGLLESLGRAGGHSHFEDAGGLHAALISFLEAAVPHGDLHVYSDGSDCQDLFGEYRGFSAPAFLYSSRSGFFACDPSLSAEARFLRGQFLDGGGLPARFRRRPIIQRAAAQVFQRVKKALNRVNFEIQKKYEDRT